MDRGTYVYCLVAAARPPSLKGVPKGPAGTGRVRLLAVDAAPREVRPGSLRRWLVVADAPLDRFGEASLNRNISNLDWVSRAAVAHERVVEAFITAPAVLPMKLLTIFASDERALHHLRAERAQIDRVLKRVLQHDEWGVRVVLDRARATSGARVPRASKKALPGMNYLAQKKSRRDAAAELADHAREAVADFYDLLAVQSGLSKRRSSSELPVQGGPLLLDAAFLVPRTRATRFRSTVARRARLLQPKGYVVSLTGPWPPYSFLQD